MRIVRHSGLALVLFLTLGIAGCHSSAPAHQVKIPRFESAACPFHPAPAVVEGRGVRCGYLSVPEDRSRPDGKTILLAVAIFKAVMVPAAPDPVLFLSGGPGSPLLSSLGTSMTYTTQLQLAPNRDIVLFDQRGTGYSQPSLDCPEETTLSAQTAAQRLSSDQRVSLEIQALRQCHDRLVKDGIDLSAYTTLEDAADVHDLIDALGYSQVNLYGISYGTRLALTVEHAYPKHIRSVLLDSTLPTQINLYIGLAQNYTRAFDVLFAGCTASATCNRQHPNLKEVFYHLVDTLNAHPVTITTAATSVDGKATTVLLTGSMLIEQLHAALYSTNLIPFLPAMIYHLSRGDFGFLSQVPLPAESSVSWGMYYSVACGEDAAYTSIAQTTAADVAQPPEVRSDLAVNFRQAFGVCQLWEVPAVPAVQKQPVKSSIPTLIFAGEFDPITPPAYGQLAGRSLSRSYFFEFPGTGHGVMFTNSCSDTIAEHFWTSPQVPPDHGCIASMSEPGFREP